MLCATILRHVAQTTDVFAERRKMDPNRSCKRVQYLAKTYALCNHFTACEPNLTFSQNGENWTEIDLCE